MRAQLLKAPGGTDQFLYTDIQKPVVKQAHVLVRVRAASVNPIDIKIRSGLPIGPVLPGVIGCDVAGVVDEIGTDVTDFKVGDEVFGCAGGVRGQGGSLAEYMLADQRLLARKPTNLSMREAAALPLVSITAWDLLERANVTKDDHVLVHGGVGGVGHIAIQLVKVRGARVATTVSTLAAGKIVLGLGADEAINYMEEEVDLYVQRLTAGHGFDVVIDTVGGSNLDRCFAAAATYGRVAGTAARSTHDLSPLHAKALSLHVVFMLLPMLQNVGRERHGDILRAIAVLAEQGKLIPLLDKHTFNLAQAPDAHRLLESGLAVGKVVVDIP